MRAVIAHSFGRPEEFHLDDVSETEPGPGEVRIEIHAAGVSFVDCLIAAGQYQVKPQLPFTPGSELAGIVDAVGTDVVAFSLGDRVCASALSGAFAEKIVLPANSVHRLPDDMDWAEGAVFRVSFATVYHALVQRAALRPGERVLVLGAGGAIGNAAVQTAKALGARVIAAASTEEKRAAALRTGAEHAVDFGAQSVRQDVKRLTGGNGVDVVVDPVGGAATELAFRMLGWSGRHLVIGFAAGNIPALPTNLALLRGAALLGVDIRQFGLREAGLARANLASLFALHRAGKLKPLLRAHYPLEAFVDAMRAARTGDAGRVVLDIAPAMLWASSLPSVNART
jgi:NADPH:quinone reductase